MRLVIAIESGFPLFLILQTSRFPSFQFSGFSVSVISDSGFLSFLLRLSEFHLRAYRKSDYTDREQENSDKLRGG